GVARVAEIDDPEPSIRPPADRARLLELARPAAGPAERTDVAAVRVEDPDLLRLALEDVDPAVVVDGQVGDLAEELGAGAVGDPDPQLLLDPPRVVRAPDPRLGVLDVDDAAGEGVDRPGPGAGRRTVPGAARRERDGQRGGEQRGGGGAGRRRTAEIAIRAGHGPILPGLSPDGERRSGRGVRRSEQV